MSKSNSNFEIIKSVIENGCDKCKNTENLLLILLKIKNDTLYSISCNKHKDEIFNLLPCVEGLCAHCVKSFKIQENQPNFIKCGAHYTDNDLPISVCNICCSIECYQAYILKYQEAKIKMLLELVSY